PPKPALALDQTRRLLLPPTARTREQSQTPRTTLPKEKVVSNHCLNRFRTCCLRPLSGCPRPSFVVRRRAWPAHRVPQVRLLPQLWQDLGPEGLDPLPFALGDPVLRCFLGT